MTGHVVGGNVRFLSPLGGTGVAMFLLLSGYGLSESFAKKGLTHYWRNKIIRVALPYFIVWNIYNLTHERCTPADANFWLNVLCLRTSFWYISYQFYCYAAFWLTFRFLQKPKARIIALVLFSCLSFTILTSIEAEQSLSFLCGVWLSQYGQKLRLSECFERNALRLLVVFAVWGIVALGVKQMPAVRAYEGAWIYDLVQLNIKLPFALACLFLLYRFANLFRFRLLAFAGVISYELYLVHFPFYGMVGSSLPIAVSLFIGSFVVAWLFYRADSAVALRLKK